MIEPTFHHHVRVQRRHSAIDQNHRQPQLFPMSKIAFDHRAPVFLHGLGNFCVSITRQIHKVDSVIDQKEIDRLRPPRRRTRTRQPMNVRQSVQQGRFANVRSTTKSDFRSLISGKITRSCRTLDESGGTDFHNWQSRGRNPLSL